MSQKHTGNAQPAIDIEEHEHTDGIGPATKRVLAYGWDGTVKNIAFVDTNGTMRSIVTIASAINTQFGGNVTLNPSSAHIGSVSIYGNLAASLAGNVTLNPSPNQIGSVTISHPISATFGGNVTLNASNAFIGLVTVANTVPVTGTFWQATQPVSGTVTANLAAGTNNIGDVDVLTLPAIPTGANYIGLATVNIGSSNATLYAVVNTGAVGTTNSLVTLLNSDAYIGLVTIANASLPVTGTFWQATQPVSGTVAATQSGTWDEVGINDSGNSITIDGSVGFTSNVTLNASNAFIGLVTIANTSLPVTQSGTWNVGTVTAVTAISNALPAGTNNIGDVDILTIAAGDNNIGNVDIVTLPALAAGANYIGLATVVQANQPALVASSAYIGLASVIPVYAPLTSLYTSVATVISAAGANVTLFVPPSGQRFVLKDLHVSSLGRNEVEFRSGATILIPMTSLSTTAGFFENYGDSGLSGKAVDQALVMAINSASTVSVMANVKFQ